MTPQVGEHRRQRRVALFRFLGEHAFEHRLQRRQLRRQRRHWARQVGEQQVRGVLGLERQPPGHHLEPQRAQAVLVGATVHRVAADLLGRHVTRRAHGQSGLGDALRFRPGAPCDAEVRQHRRVVVAEQHVVGLDVAMHDAQRMRRVQCRRQLRQHVQAFAQAQPGREPVGQAAVAEVLHADVVALVGGDHVIDGDDVGVAQPGEGMRLVDEALRQFAVAGDRAVEQLQRDRALQRALGRQVDDRHAAAPEFADELVARKIFLHRLLPQGGDRPACVASVAACAAVPGSAARRHVRPSVARPRRARCRFLAGTMPRGEPA